MQTVRPRGRLWRWFLLPDVFQGMLQVPHVLPARLRILGQAALHYALERRWNSGAVFAERSGILFENRGEHAGRRVAAKRLGSADQLVEHAAEREDVGAGIHVLSLDLLW